MATNVSKARLCLSQDLGNEVTVLQLRDHLDTLIANGRAFYKVQLDDDQMGNPVDVRSMQVFDQEKIVELTHV